MGSEALGLVATYIKTGPDWKTAEQILNSLSPSNPNIIRRINVRSLKEALQAHGIECKIEKIRGYKMELFKCQVIDGLSFGTEPQIPLEAPF